MQTIFCRVLAATALLIPSSAYAWGLIVPDAADTADTPACVQITQQKVEVSIDGSTGTYVSRIGFRVQAPTGAEVLVPILSGDGARARLDDRPLALSMLDRGAALEHLVELVADRPTPALLATSGLAVGAARVQLSAGEHVLIVEGAPIVDMSGDVPRIVQPLRNLGTACSTPSIEVQVDLRSERPIGAIFTPYHDREVERVNAHQARVRVRTSSGQQCHDLHLYLTSSEASVAASALTYRDPACGSAEPDGEPGYMLLTAGATATESTQAVAKDVALVIDTSGSMGGGKIEQVKRALLSILENLQPADRFNLVTFSGDVNSVFGELVDASDTARLERAREVARSLQADGSTNINDALMTAISELSDGDSARPRLVIFLTDGEATAGVREPTAIVSNVVAANEIGARVFSFGVGDSVNTRLLDELARQTAGRAIYVRPGASIDAALAGFYEEIQAPIATELDLITEGVTLSERYPDQFPDLFVGSEFFGLSRYNQAPSARLTLNGRTDNGLEAFDVVGTIARRSTTHSFLPRLWASRQLGELLYQARENGGEQSTIDQIQRLALRFGFVTRFTPFTVDGEGEVDVDYRNPTGDEVGSEAVATSGATNDLAGNSNAGAYGAANGRAPIKQVLDRTFIREQGYWTDSRVAHDLDGNDVIELMYLGPGWRQLLASSPELGAILSTGRSIAFEWGCRVIRVTNAEDHPDTTPREDPVPMEVLAAAGAEALPVPAGPRPRPIDDSELSQVKASCQSTGGTPDVWLLLVVCFGAMTIARKRTVV